jgi:arylformamidase
MTYINSNVLYDITRTINPGIAVWPGDSPFQMDVIAAMAEGSSVNLTTIHLSSHTGTHADAWWHYSEDGARIGSMPLDRYIGPAQVIRVARTSGGITVADLGGVDIASAQRILLHTAISDLPDNQWPEPFPYLTVELVDYLSDHGICLVGIDSPSVDAVDSKTLPCHNQIRARGMANLENLQLHGVPDGRYELIALPLRLETACGSPVRAVLRQLANHSG